jgi:RHS repeat-associated protein
MTSYTKLGVLTEYIYDGDGHRVKKIDHSATPAVTTVFVYNAGGQLIAEYTTASPPGGGTSYLTSDHLGSTRVVTNSDGTVVKGRYDYLPFGEELPTNQRPSGIGYGGADATRQKFTQKERDSESGLDYFLARYYSSAQGRFTSPDSLTGSIATPQSLNLYSYVESSPLRLVDPSGNFSISALDSETDLLKTLQNWRFSLEPLPPSKRRALAQQASDGTVQVGNIASVTVKAEDCWCIPQKLKNYAKYELWESDAWVDKIVNGMREWLKTQYAAAYPPGRRPDLDKWSNSQIIYRYRKETSPVTPELDRWLAGARAGKGRGANTKQNAETDRIIKEEGLSKGQQEILHRWISKEGYTPEEIRDLARDIKDSFPNK